MNFLKNGIIKEEILPKCVVLIYQTGNIANNKQINLEPTISILLYCPLDEYDNTCRCNILLIHYLQ